MLLIPLLTYFHSFIFSVTNVETNHKVGNWPQLMRYHVEMFGNYTSAHVFHSKIQS